MKKTINEKSLFWLGYFLIIFSDMFVMVDLVSSLLDYINVIGLILIILYNFITSSYDWKTTIIMIILFLCSIFSYSIFKDFIILKFLILLFSLKKMDFDELIKKDITIKISLTLLLILLFILGLTNSQTFIRNESLRYSLGFTHPNTAGFYFMIIAFELIYLYRGKIKKTYIFYLILLAIMVNELTGSRSSVISIILLSIFLLYYKYSKCRLLNNKIIKFVVRNSFFILMLFSFIVTMKYQSGTSLAIKLNSILSGRLSLFSFYVSRYNIMVFGNDLITKGNMTLDNSYLYLLLKFGIISFLVYYLLYRQKIMELYQNKDYVFIFIILTLMIYGLMEITTLKSTYNIFLLSFSTLLFKSSKEKKIK